MEFKNIIKEFTIDKMFDALKKYGRIFSFRWEEYFFVFRILTLSEIKLIDKTINNGNDYIKTELEDYIVSNAVIFAAETKYDYDTHQYKEVIIENINDLPAMLVTVLFDIILRYSTDYDIEKLIDNIENMKDYIESPIDIALTLALQINPNIDKDNITYEDIIRFAAIKDSQFEVSIKERYLDALDKAKKAEAERKTKEKYGGK